MPVFGKDETAKLKEHFYSKSLAAELCPFKSRETATEKERLGFDPDELISKMKKSLKYPNKNIFKLPLATISALSLSERDLMMFMVSYHDDVMEDYVIDFEVLGHLQPEFTGMACTVLSKHWKKHELFEQTLSCVGLAARHGNHVVVRSLVEERVILACVLAASFARERKIITPTHHFDTYNETVLSILCCVPKGHGGDIGRFDSEYIKAFLLMAPNVVYFVTAYQDEEWFEEFAFFTRILLLAMFKFHDHNRKVVNKFMTKYKFHNVALDYITENTFGAHEDEDIDNHILRCMEIVFLLREEIDIKDLLLVLPNLLSTITKIPCILNFHSIHKQYWCYDETDRIPASLGILSYNIENASSDSAVQFLNKDFFSKLLNGIVEAANENKETETVQITKVLWWAMLRYRLLALDDLRISDKVYYSTMQHLCNKIQNSMLPSSNSLICLSYLFYYSLCFSHEDEQSMLCISDEMIIIKMMQALTVVYYSEETEKLKFSAVFDQYVGDPSAWFSRYVNEFISHVEYKGGQDTSNKLAKIVNANLPEIVAQFAGKGAQLRGVSFMYSEIITRLVLVSLDTIEGFYSDNWKDVRSLVIEREYFNRLIISRKRIYSTSLLFMWKVAQMDQREPFVSSILQLEESCRNSEYGGSEIETLLDRFYDKLDNADGSDCDNETLKNNHFKYLIADFKLLLSNPEHFTIFVFEDKISELHKITRLMFTIAQNIQDKRQQDQLKGLVFWALDLVQHCKDDEIVRTNVNNFIIYVYLKDYD